MKLSVVIPTRNPDLTRLAAVLDGLVQQDLPATEWELVIVDNGSSPPLALSTDRFQLTNLRIVREARAGLLYARLTGMRETTAPFLLFIDDDTVPQPHALRAIVDAFEGEPQLGVTGGRILPRWAVPPPPWIHKVSWALALRDNGPQPLRWAFRPGTSLPDWTPIGAGLALRRDALVPYYEHVAQHEAEILRRSWKGQGLGGNEDKDLVCRLLRAGWMVGYEPGFVLHHIIPEGRLQLTYFRRLLPALEEMWMRTLHAHGMNPFAPVHPATVPLRKIKAWFSFRAWAGTESHLGWLCSCGRLDGLAYTHREQRY